MNCLPVVAGSFCLPPVCTERAVSTLRKTRCRSVLGGMRIFECHLTPMRNTCHETSRESTPFCTSLESCHNSPVLYVSQIREQPCMFDRSFPLLYVMSPNELFTGRRREFLSPTLLHGTCRLNSP
ncbi:hypothetical protein AVEN_148530-1 [Araneus ventricosus]|uniref:Uncharacterized protein n=1 Tax=Araneus ventricosus TaxID=182803 RepID=A0A4Y2BKX2_ARAVE|nr:hypothetical protein AVEN_148530-1 [Araneus ventricosus]